MSTSTQRQDYCHFEREGWDAAAPHYDRHFGELARLAAEPLMREIPLEAGDQFLDLACGPGYLAEVAVARGASAFGVDFADAMIAQAQRRVPAARFTVAAAETLPFADEEFSGIALNLSLHHCWDAEEVCREAYRTLKPGGRFAVTVWGRPQDRAIGLGLLMQAIAEHGNADVGLPPGPPLFRLSSPSQLQQLFEESGFAMGETLEIDLPWCVASSQQFLDAFFEAGVRIGQILRRQSPASLEAIAKQLHSSFLSFTKDELGCRIPMGICLAWGTKT